MDCMYAPPFPLWDLDDLTWPIAPNSGHRLAFSRDPIAFSEVRPLTVDTGLEDATEYFRRAQEEVIQSTLVDLHA